MAFRNKIPNPLHKAASYNTLFTLSGLREDEIRSKSFLTNAPHDIIARTGGIGNPRVSPDPVLSVNRGQGGAEARLFDRTLRDALKDFSDNYSDSVEILERGHDLFVENVNILSTLGPNNERNLANFTKMEFEIHEPYGITLIEKVRAATAINGFRDYQDAPLLLTIEFKGVDNNGQSMSFADEKVSDGLSYQLNGLVRKIPILIVRVDFDVNEGGAKYTVTAVPYTDMGFDDRFKFPRTKIPIATDSPEDWAKAVVKRIDDDMEEEIKEKKRQFKDTYKFEIDEEVKKQAKGYGTEDESQNFNTPAATTADLSTARDLAATGDIYTADTNKRPKTFKSFAQANSFTALTKFFEDAIRGDFGYAELASNFWVGYLNGLGFEVDADNPEKIINVLKSPKFQDRIAKKPFIPWFKIKSTILTDTSRLDKVTKMHPKTIIFRAMPYKVHVLKMVGAGMSANVDWSSYVRKEYNYLYTGENVDVQGLRINYKSAYYMRNVREAKTPTQDGAWAEIKQFILQPFGKEDAPDETLPLRSYPSVLKGRSSVETVNKHNPKAQEFFDYLTNPEADMMRIELDILGDPAFLCQDIYVPSADKEGPPNPFQSGKDFDTDLQCFNADQYMPCINLIYRLPSDLNDKEGTMFGGDGKKYREENLFFSGVYQVVKVDNQINSGQFTQTLTCVRLNNQNGEGVPIALIRSYENSVGQLEKYAKKKVEDKKAVIERYEEAGKVLGRIEDYGDSLK